MKKHILAVVCTVSILMTSLCCYFAPMASAEETDNATGRTYYISSINGDNANDATTEAKAWQTLDMLENITFNAGDRILLQSGSVFEGFIHLRNASGTQEAPIIIGKYGTGNKPIINANGQGIWYQDYNCALDNSGHKSRGYISSAILLYDCDFVEISDLEITNELSDFDERSHIDDLASDIMDRTGVAGLAQNGGVMQHIYLDNLYIHDVDGNLEDKHVDNGGIQMNVSKPLDEATTGIARYDDVSITNCYVKDVSRAGISVGYTYNWAQFQGHEISDDTAQTYGHTNMYFANNYIQNSGNDALVVMYSYAPLVENNISDGAGADLDDGYEGYWQSFCSTIWPWKCKNAIFQYNEAFDTIGEGNGDGQAWDIDYSDSTVYQYNYSHNNGGGAFLICLTEAYKGVFRYNISYNDLGCLITLQGNPEAKIYNNVFYVDGDLATRVHHEAAGKRGGAAYIANNIFYNISSNNPNDTWVNAASQIFINNIYYGYTSTPANDTAAITADPQFINAASAPTEVKADGKVYGLDAFEGFKIAETSPAVNAGIYITKNGGKDFFGNKLGTTPDIGVFETSVEDLDVGTILSDEYQITGTVISDVTRNTSVETFLSHIIAPSGYTIEMISDGEVITTGEVTDEMTLRVTNAENEVTNYSIVILIIKTYKEYPVTGMTGTVGSYQPNNTTEGNANLALDNDTSTIWHTSWDGCAQGDVWFTLDMGKVQPVSYLKYVPRQGGGVNGMITSYQIMLSDDNATWHAATLSGANTWAQDATTKTTYFTTENARYVKLVGLTSASSEAGKIFGSAAEIRVGYLDGDEPTTDPQPTVEYREYEASSMTVAAVGSAESVQSSAPGSNVLDNDNATVWHTDWNGCAQSDVWITLDLGSSKEVAMLKYVPRPAGAGDGSLNGNITSYKIMLSDDNSSWHEANLTSGNTWANDNTTKYAYFNAENARYVKLVAISSYSAEAGKIFGSAAEIRLGYQATEI